MSLESRIYLSLTSSADNAKVQKNYPIFTVTYRVYIRKDYKPVIRYVPDQPWYRRIGLRLPLVGGIILTPFLFTIIPSTPGQTDRQTRLAIFQPEIPAYRTPIAKHRPAEPQQVPDIAPADHQANTSAPQVTPPEAKPAWQNVTVAAGDSMSLIFDRLGLGPALLYKVMHSDDEAAALKDLIPGQELRFRIEDDTLQVLEYEKDLTTTLVVNRSDEGFSSEVVTTPLKKRVVEAEGTIEHSLYLAGRNAGMSDNLIMQLVAIYGWDIDFAMNIRSGDHFKLLYEEHYKDGVKVREGPILAADFNNRGKSFRAVRYTNPEGKTDYYAESGASMRKAFLRNPLDVFRISSHFNPNRRHPVLNTIRAHQGTDYAAPTGTPIKATGDGRIIHIGRKGGYGNAVILRHGGRYSTLYGHLSRFRSSLRYGSHVEQGQIIGYVGMSGLATGPHLHYEFRVNGVHRNPLTVQLPKAESIPDRYMDDFKLKSRTLLAALEDDSKTAEETVLAMREKQPEEKLLPDNY